MGRYFAVVALFLAGCGQNSPVANWDGRPSSEMLARDAQIADLLPGKYESADAADTWLYFFPDRTFVATGKAPDQTEKVREEGTWTFGNGRVELATRKVASSQRPLRHRTLTLYFREKAPRPISTFHDHLPWDLGILAIPAPPGDRISPAAAPEVRARLAQKLILQEASEARRAEAEANRMAALRSRLASLPAEHRYANPEEAHRMLPGTFVSGGIDNSQDIHLFPDHTYAVTWMMGPGKAPVETGRWAYREGLLNLSADNGSRDVPALLLPLRQGAATQSLVIDAGNSQGYTLTQSLSVQDAARMKREFAQAQSWDVSLQLAIVGDSQPDSSAHERAVHLYAQGARKDDQPAIVLQSPHGTRILKAAQLEVPYDRSRVALKGPVTVEIAADSPDGRATTQIIGNDVIYHPRENRYGPAPR